MYNLSHWLVGEFGDCWRLHASSSGLLPVGPLRAPLTDGFVFQNVVHELRITNQVIYLNPPIEDCRYKLYQEMFSWKMVILSLPRIQSQRYQVPTAFSLGL